MAPGEAQNSETILNGTLSVGNGGVMKTCPVEVTSVQQKPKRKLIRPKVLKNLESGDYLYDRLYDTECPRTVSVTYALLTQISDWSLF